MAEDTEPLETLNANAERAVKQAEQVVEKTSDQTRGALDNCFNFMQKAFSFYPVRRKCFAPCSYSFFQPALFRPLDRMKMPSA